VDIMAKKQRSLFEYETRLDKISGIGDPLERLNKRIPWNKLFRNIIEKALTKEKKGPGGRIAYDYIMMMKILIIQRAYNLSDEQIEFQINDRLSFQRFLELSMSDDVPDFSTVWRFRESLIETKVIGRLFKRFNNYLLKENIIMNQGSIVDASFVDVPRQRNSRDENKNISNGKTPEDWSDKKKEHKDVDARWAKKNQETHYGYKNHVKTDSKSKIITKYTVTSANVHDSQELKNLIDKNDENKPLHADSAYKSEKNDKLIRNRKIINKIHEKGFRNNPLSGRQIPANKMKSKTRVRIEHIF